MSTTVSYNFFIVVGTSHTKDGNISLTYALNNDGSISSATFTYSNPGAQGPYPVTFTGTASPYSGTCSMAPPTYQPLNVIGQGSYKSGTITLDTSANATYPLSGVFKQAASPTADPGDLSWDAGTGDGLPAEAKKAAGK